MNSDDLTQFIETHDIQADIVFLDEHTPTVEAAADAVGVRPEQILKSVLFVVKEGDGDYRPLLVISNGLSRIDYKSLADHLGVSRKRLRMARPKQVLAMTGYPVGTVPPFGHTEVVPTVLDEDVTRQEKVYAGGGAINALMRLKVAELQRVLDAPVVNVSE